MTHWEKPLLSEWELSNSREGTVLTGQHHAATVKMQILV